MTSLDGVSNRTADMPVSTDVDALVAENADLRRRLDESEETMRALRNGEIDALVIGERLYTLEASDAALNRFLGDILSQVGDAVVATDRGDRIIYLNAAAERRYGVRSSDILGCPIGRMYSVGWRGPADEADALAVFDDAGAWQGESVHRTNRGEELQVETTLRRLTDRAGTTIGRLAVIRDVSERARAQAALQSAHDAFRHLVENSPFGVYTVDADFRLANVSLGARKVFETVPRPLIGRDFADVMRTLWPEPFASEAIDRFRHTLGTGEPYRSESMVERRGDIGVVESYDWLIERVVLTDGRPGVVCHFYDLTERQRLEAALRESADRLRESDQRKDVFLAMLAHELRNPLAPIRNAAEVLQRTCGDRPQSLRAASAIARQTAHLARLVDDLLDVSRVTQGKIRLAKVPTPLAEVIEAGIELARPLIDRERHDLVVELPDEPLHVLADPIRLTQVIDNLLNNAAKFTAAGGRIVLAAVRDGERVRISVQDTGIGIAPELLPRMFELFTQGDRSLDRSQGGLGLGLALVRHLVDLHDGSITAHSDGPGTGSRFVVELPLTPCGRVEATRPEAPRVRRRILVVDDNVDSAESLAALLELEGHVVACAPDGDAALAVAPDFRPDACLLDIGLPGMDGYELALRLRATPEAASACYIALSGYSRTDHEGHAHAARFDHFLGKPVSPDRLIDLLSSTGPG